MAAKRKTQQIGFGPVTGAELASIGLDTPAQVRAVGWEEAFERWVEAFPHRLNVNAAVGMVSIVDDVSWLKLPARRKAAARRLVESLRERLRQP